MNDSYAYRVTFAGVQSIVVSSTGSDLEAFSHYLTDDSFAALAVQLTANTNYRMQRFLSY